MTPGTALEALPRVPAQPTGRVDVTALLAQADAAQQRSHESRRRAASAGIHLREAVARSDAWFTRYAHPRATKP
jgi:hypothetical protein